MQTTEELEMTEVKYKSVMVVDDTYADMYITSRVVTKLRITDHVMQYSSGEEALDYLGANCFDTDRLPELIFLDIYMPGMTGFQFMEQYDALPATVKNHCKVFIISSTFDSEDIARARSYRNVADFIEKPLKKEILQRL